MLICVADPRSRFFLLSFWNEIDFILHCLNGNKVCVDLDYFSSHLLSSLSDVCRAEARLGQCESHTEVAKMPTPCEMARPRQCLSFVDAK